MQTTEDEFDFFKTECDKWIRVFGLLGWGVLYEHVDIKENWYASVRVNNLEDRIALFSFNKNITEGEREFLDIRKTAFHEVMELLLWPMHYIGESRYTSPEELTEARHVIIRTLENIVYPVMIRATSPLLSRKKEND